MVWPGTRLLAGLRGSRPGHPGRKVARRARHPTAGVAEAHRCVRRPRARALRPGDVGRRARLPAFALRERRRHRRSPHARGALRRGRRLSAPDAHRDRRGIFVSSILDALEKLERSRPPALEPPPAPPPRRRGRIALLIGAAIGGGAALALTLLLGRPGGGPAEPATPAPE